VAKINAFENYEDLPSDYFRSPPKDFCFEDPPRRVIPPDRAAGFVKTYPCRPRDLPARKERLSQADHHGLHSSNFIGRRKGMPKRILWGIWICFLIWIPLDAEPLPVISVETGMNVVSIQIHNKLGIGLESLFLEIRQDLLPQGLSLETNPQSLDVPPNTTSEAGLILHIRVDEKTAEGIHEIPVTVKDKNGHAWPFILKVKVAASRPDQYELFRNYPNPFNASTEIRYDLAGLEEEETRLVIYDLLGREIRTLVCEKQPPGRYHVIWDGRDESGREVASGVYMYQLTSGSFVRIHRMTLLK